MRSIEHKVKTKLDDDSFFDSFFCLPPISDQFFTYAIVPGCCATATVFGCLNDCFLECCIIFPPSLWLTGHLACLTVS